MNQEERTNTAEHRLIEWIRDCAGNTGIGDDCAVLPGQLLVTSDTLVEGTHFLTSIVSPADLGWKSVAVNLSDIAAMGGRPRHIIVSLTMPEHFKVDEFRELFSSMVGCARTYRAEIAGGDLTRGPVLVLTLTVIGEIHESGCLTRAGAQPGDVVIVSGDFGAAAGGLWVLREGLSGYAHLKRAHLRPQPRLAEAWSLVSHAGSRGALMDASDGLADALVQISRQSKTGMEIDLSKVPLHPETVEAAKLAGIDPLDWALYGGEDYELVGTIPQSVWDILGGSESNSFAAIGRVKSSAGIVLSGAGNRQLDLSKSFQHWSDELI